MLSFILASCSALAGDWPQWRGLRGDAHAQGEELPDSWPVAGPPVLWTRELGQGYSAFVVAGDRAYTQAQSLYEQFLLCLDANTGATLWSYRYGWTYDGGGLYPGPRATPSVVDGRVYFVAPNGLIGCVDGETGAPLWSVNLKEQHAGKGTDFGVAASPLVWSGRVFIPVGGEGISLAALDAATGNLLWKCGSGPASYATPIIAEFGSRSLVIAPLENSLLCADALTGDRLWELELSSGYDEHSAAPIYSEPFLLLAGPFRSGARCYRLIPDGDHGCRAEVAWETSQFSNDVASSVRVGGHLYGFDLRDQQSRLHRPSRGQFRCLDWQTGRTVWSSDQPGHANAIVAGDKLLLFNDRGELILSRASADGYQELARARVLSEEICWTPPALSDGRVFLRSQTRAVCLAVGKRRSTSSPGSQTLAAIPQIRRFDPTVLLGGEREFPAATPEPQDLWRWYLWNTAVMLGSWLGWRALPASVDRLRRPAVPSVRCRQAGAVPDTATLLAFGVFGSAALNPRLESYLFTWPLATWCLFEIAVNTSLRAVRRQADRRSAWQARLAILGLVLGSLAYFHACRVSGLATEWSFLVGFVTAAPVMLGAAWIVGESRSQHTVVAIVLRWASWTIYWIGCVEFMHWRLSVGS